MSPPLAGCDTSAVAAAWTLAGTIRDLARARADGPMLTCGAETTTFAEMDRRSSRVANGLLAAGVRAQDRVAFVEKNGREYFEVLYGCGKVNAVTVAVNWRLTAGEMRTIIDDAAATVLVIGEEFRTVLDELRAGLATVHTVLVVGAASPEESYDAWVDAQSDTDPMAPVGPGDVALQHYTSGTTGLPKGAMLTNLNLGLLLRTVAARWEIDESSVSLVALPLFHIGGSAWALIGIEVGARSVVVRDPVPAGLLDVIERERISNAFLVPALLNFLTMVPGAADRDLTALRTIVYGASPITADALERAMATFRCKFVQVYGLTETTGAITELPFSDHRTAGPDRRLLRSAGRPFPWVELRVVGPTGADLPAGEVGEVWTRSSQNMAGYWNHPADTAAAFEGAWFKTGDAGYLDEQGYLFLTDRVKDMIDSGGENVYPAEVEDALAAHPAVADVAVIGVLDARWGETVKAIVVPVAGTDVTAEELIAFARSRLAAFKCPTSVDFAETLPRNPSGKILKRLLREPYWAGHQRRIG